MLIDTESFIDPSTPIASLTLSVLRNCGDRTLLAGSRKWHALRTEILARDNYTCSSCAYMSPDRQGTGLGIDHRDGDASNNDLSNLGIHCSPCGAIRQCGFAGLKKWLRLANSNMEQTEIVRRTREIFEKSGKIPSLRQVDPFATPARIDTADLANELMKSDWDGLTEEYKRLRGFFTQYASGLFAVTSAIGLSQLTTVQSSNLLTIQATKLRKLETSRPWIHFSPKVHSGIQDFIAKWPPSSTLKSQAAWICISNGRLQPTNNETSIDLASLDRAWNVICANRQPGVADLDDLARRFDVLEGKWMVFAHTRHIDFWWSQIAIATHAGMLGISAKVSPRDDSDTHVICVYTQNYTDEAGVYKVRQGLHRLGMNKSIGYKPDIYTHCRVYTGNSWSIPPTRYHD